MMVNQEPKYKSDPVSHDDEINSSYLIKEACNCVVLDCAFSELFVVEIGYIVIYIL